jgi:serine/threonine-protein kinase
MLTPGSLITDRLAVVRRVGAGGLGEVYEVEHKFTRHRRAVKVLHRQFQQNADVVERFLREASAAGRIGNPHIVETFDAGHLSDGSPFIVMEFLQGKSLSDVLRAAGRLEPGLAAAVLCQVCTAIQAAHDANIIHRDLKPDNLFLTEREGRAFVKVLDFGISKFQSDEGAELSTTRSGITMGTPLYMAPEQLRGAKNADARSDVYSLGVILYEMLVGIAPFTGDSFAELAVQILTAEPKPIHSFDGALPEALSHVVTKSLDKNPEVRFQTAKALGEVLEPFARNASITVLLAGGAQPAEPGTDTFIRPVSQPAPTDRATPMPLKVPTLAPEGPTNVSKAAQAVAPAAGATSLGQSELRAVTPNRGRGLAFAGLALAGVGALGFWFARPAPAPVVVPVPTTEPATVARPPPTPAPMEPPPMPPPMVAVEPPPPEKVPVAQHKGNSRQTKKDAPPVKPAVEPMVPEPAVVAAPATGIVDLACSPVACSVSIDGKAVGETPVLGHRLEVGGHSATLTNTETHATTTRQFEIKAGEKTRLPITW